MRAETVLSVTDLDRCFISGALSPRTFFCFNADKLVEGLSCWFGGVIELPFKFACAGKIVGFDIGERGGGIVWNPKLGVDDSEANAGCGGSVVTGERDQKIFWI